MEYIGKVVTGFWRSIFPPPDRTVVVVGTNRKFINQLVRERCNISIAAQDSKQFYMRHFEISLYCYCVNYLSAAGAVRILEFMKSNNEHHNIPSTWYLIVPRSRIKTFLSGSTFQCLLRLHIELHFQIRFVEYFESQFVSLSEHEVVEELYQNTDAGLSRRSSLGLKVNEQDLIPVLAQMKMGSEEEERKGAVATGVCDESFRGKKGGEQSLAQACSFASGDSSLRR